MLLWLTVSCCRDISKQDSWQPVNLSSNQVTLSLQILTSTVIGTIFNILSVVPRYTKAPVFFVVVFLIKKINQLHISHFLGYLPSAPAVG